MPWRLVYSEAAQKDARKLASAGLKGKAQRLLEYQPRVTLDDGLAELAAWLDGQRAVDQVEFANYELAQRGLTA